MDCTHECGQAPVEAQRVPIGLLSITNAQKLPGFVLLELAAHSMPQTLSDSTGVHHPGGFSSRAALTESNTQQPLPAHFGNHPQGTGGEHLGQGWRTLTKVPLALPLSFGPENSLVPSRDLSKPVELSSLSSVSSGYSSALTE